MVLLHVFVLTVGSQVGLNNSWNNVLINFSYPVLECQGRYLTILTTKRLSRGIFREFEFRFSLTLVIRMAMLRFLWRPCE
jgi:Mn2+/Fe2+ NRAMP family transporter